MKVSIDERTLQRPLSGGSYFSSGKTRETPSIVLVTAVLGFVLFASLEISNETFPIRFFFFLNFQTLIEKYFIPSKGLSYVRVYLVPLIGVKKDELRLEN